jgi:hypothetical protein
MGVFDLARSAYGDFSEKGPTQDQMGAAKKQYGTESGWRSQQQKAAAKSLFAANENVGNLEGMFNKQAKDMAAATQSGRQAIHQQQAQALSGALSAGGRNLAGGGGQYGLAQSAARNAGLAESGFLADQNKMQQEWEQNRNAQMNAAKANQAQAESDYATKLKEIGTEDDAANNDIAKIQTGLSTAKDQYSHAMGNDFDGMAAWLNSQRALYGGNPKVAQWIDNQIAQVHKARQNTNPFQNNAWDAIGNV